MKIAVLGTGAWGTALALSLSRVHDIRLWGRDRTLVDHLERIRVNSRYLPGFVLPPEIVVEHDLRRVLGFAELLVVAVPTTGLRQTLRALARHGVAVPVIWASKGFEPGTAKLLHEVAEEELPPALPHGVLSGPSFAQEVAQGLPCALTLAARDAGFAHHAAVALNHNRMRVYSSTDVIGVELGGAVKNVIAIAAGISDGMGFGHNARAALITRGLAEMTRLGLALGGRLETFMGLAGAGDLVLTCTGDFSRNRSIGRMLAAGTPLAEAQATLGHAAEGVHTCAEVLKKARAAGVDMPITQVVHQVMFEGLAPGDAVEALLSREPKAEYLEERSGRGETGQCAADRRLTMHKE